MLPPRRPPQARAFAIPRATEHALEEAEVASVDVCRAGLARERVGLCIRRGVDQRAKAEERAEVISNASRFAQGAQARSHHRVDVMCGRLHAM